MSCKNTCSRRIVKHIKFEELTSSAHVVSHDDLDNQFLVVNVDGVAYMELVICPVDGSELTALFEIATVDDGFGVIVPDYVADLNEKLLNDLDIIPIIADDPEFVDEDEDEDFDDDEDFEEVEECEDDLEQANESVLDDLAKLDKKAHGMVSEALATEEGKYLFSKFVTAATPEEECEWLGKLVEYVASGKRTEPVEDPTERLLKAIFGDKAKDEDTADKHSCSDCGKCKKGSGKVGELGAGMVGMRIGDMPKELQDILKAQLGVPKEEAETEAKAAATEDKPEGKPCASGVRWTEEEDKELLKLGVAVGCFGISWDDVAIKLGRTPDACRKRFYKIKGIQK